MEAMRADIYLRTWVCARMDRQDPHVQSRIYDHLDAMSALVARRVCRAFRHASAIGCIVLEFDRDRTTSVVLRGHRGRRRPRPRDDIDANPEFDRSRWVRNRTRGRLPRPEVIEGEDGESSSSPLEIIGASKHHRVAMVRVERCALDSGAEVMRSLDLSFEKSRLHAGVWM